MNILAITFGDSNCASSYYRVYQYQQYFKNNGILLDIIQSSEFKNWNTVSFYDAVIIQKKLFPTFKVRKIRKLARKLIYDIDDAIWEPHGREHHWLTQWRTNRRLKKIVSNSDLCICPNQFIKSYISPMTRRCELIPMALDETRWNLRKTQFSLNSIITVGWIGSPSNLHFFTAIEPALLTVQRKYKNVEFVVFSGERPRLHQLLIKHIPYNPENEIETVSTFDIGLLPLDTTPFAQGKSPIKALKYLACGIPCIATPTMGVREIFGETEVALFSQTEDEWVERLELLINSPLRRVEIGKKGRELFEKNYALSKNAAKFIELLLSL